MKKNTYENNIYVQNKEEIFAISRGEYDGKQHDTGVCLDIYDSKHGLEHNDLLRAQFHAALNLPMSKAYQQLLKEEE